MRGKYLVLKSPNNEVENLEAEIQVDIVSNAVLDAEQQGLYVGEVQEFKTSCQIGYLRSADDSKKIP